MAFTATLYGDPLPEGHKFPALGISLINTREKKIYFAVHESAALYRTNGPCYSGRSPHFRKESA
jgi:hypothetical protein